jgi:Domain of unknown function (DUF4304)
MPRSALAKTIVEAVKRGLAPPLREIGFRKTGTNFYQLTSESNKLVHIQSSQWNSASLSRFTIELGIYFPSIDGLMDQQFTRKGTLPWSPKIFNCQLRRRIGLLLPINRDFWWEVTPATDANHLATELAQAWQSYGAPWMNRNSNLGAAVLDLEAQSLYWVAAAGRLSMGEREQASRLARAFIESFTKQAAHPANAELIEKHLTNIHRWCATHKIKL